MSDYPTAHIPRVAGVRPARHRRPAPGDADAVDLSALLAEYRQVAGQRRHHRRAAPETETPAPVVNGTDVFATPTPTLAPTPTRAPVAAPSKSRAGRNLPAAIGVSLGLGAAIIASLFIYRPSFVGIAIAAVAYGIYELVTAIRTVEARPSFIPLLVGGVSMDVAAWYRGPGGLVVALLVTVCGVMVWRLADGASGYLRDVSASVFVLIYLPLLAGFAVLLTHPDDGAARVLAFIGTVVCSDTGGYATGVLFGKHPLAPVVSKGKTWEGFVGSVAACCACGALIMTLTFHEVWWKGALFGLAIVVTATLGLKDMGRLLPGHGGIMDRLDSLLPCAAVAYLVLSAFAPV